MKLEVLRTPSRGDTTKPPILFVHGLGHEASCWDNWQAMAADEGYDAYALSLRGHGNSDGHVRRATLSHYRDDVLQAVQGLPAPPVLVGHSLGGLVVQQALLRCKARAGVLLATVPARAAVGSLLRIARQHPLDAAGILAGRTLPMRPGYMFEKLPDEEAQKLIERCGPESPWAQYQLLLHRRPAAPDVPLLVVGSRQDRLIPVVDLRATARHYGTELIEFPDLGHNLMQDSGWQAPWRAVSDWLNRTL